MSLIKCPECAAEVSSEAPACPSCGYPINPANAEPEFRRYRKRKFIGLLILCLLALPIGRSLQLPGVWGLALLGIAVAGFKLARMSSREA